MSGELYMITSINPQSQRMIFQPPSAFPGTCLSQDFQMQGIQLDNSSPFNITGDTLLYFQNRGFSECIYYKGTSEWVYGVSELCEFGSFFALYKVAGARVGAYVGNAAAVALQNSNRLSVICRSPSARRPRIPQMLEQRGAFARKAGTGILPPDIVEVDNPQPQGAPPPPLPWSHVEEVNRRMCLPAARVEGILQRRYTKRAARNVLIKECEEILNANNTSGKSSKIFTGKEIKKANNDFAKENLLGSGTDIAVKRAKPGNAKANYQVLNEVRILCQVNHRSLVGLIGCCVELEQPLLIYEYISNGTLFDHLHGFHLRQRPQLNWLQRLTIAHQVDDGLAYLHSSAVPPIYHRDVKTSNILLDDKLDAKVSDFVLSQLVELSERDCTHIYTSAQGTLGYLDPECYLNLQLTDRSDVYSFGVVLMELLTSKKAVDFNREEENVNLVVYMKRIVDEEKLMDVVDPVLKEGASKVELETIKAIGNLAEACLDERRQNRPSMKEVAEEIEYVISILTGEVSKA
ncbi:Wall-associated receptor kinase-like 20 [Abeliophyllum distichum]|uniref:Wall-associated receptor kinase-like 20 n=1 Tax=Abeliophyllum distichum TaxID=126358 RepID=A0ABD1QZI7_9LAMI